MISTSRNKAFTFIELMIVIAILGVLATLISGNFITSLKKGRDARRKTDLEQIQRALEMYYEDNKAYPAAISFGVQLNHPLGSGTKTYMQKVPNDPISANTYKYSSLVADCPDGAGTCYILYSCIENSLDLAAGVKQTGYGINCGGCGLCKYKITSSNIQP